MPTYEALARFLRDYARLAPDEKDAFRIAVLKFVHDLRVGVLCDGLRVKRVRGAPGVWEMTGDDDGRATFSYGDPKQPGDPHIIWRRIGTHDVLDEP